MPHTEEIATALLQRQEISAEDAARIARDIDGRGGQILKAALQWVESERFPEFPTIQNLTPAALAEEFRPSQVLTLLLDLADNPGHALHWIRRARATRNLRRASNLDASQGE